MSGRQAVAIVARREIVERSREKSFLVSAVINIVIVVAVILLSAVLGGEDEYVVGFTGDRAVAEAAQRTAQSADVTVELREVSPAAGSRGARGRLARRGADVRAASRRRRTSRTTC